MGALLALISSVAWGSADVAGGLGARRVGSVRVIAVNYPAGAIILTLFALFIVPGTIDREVILLSMVTAVVGTLGMVLLYAALAVGPMGIVSPLTAIGGAAIPVIVGVVRGEPLTLLFALGAILALIAVVLVSRESRPHARITPRALLLLRGSRYRDRLLPHGTRHRARRVWCLGRDPEQMVVNARHDRGDRHPAVARWPREVAPLPMGLRYRGRCP